MFRDLAVLVTDQVKQFFIISFRIFFVYLKGELIDSIEHNVEKATGFVKDAKQNVNRAATLRKKIIQVKNLI